MRRLVLSFLLLAFTFPAFTQAKHPFTFEDMMKLKRVGEPEVSPDGKWVIFSVVDVDLEANTKTPHLWIIPTAGGEEREIISAQDADRPRWAPNGKRFAFLSTKEGGAQVWSADFDGMAGTVTGVHRLTAMPTEAGGELWSPGGTYLLFTSDVYPECDAPAPNSSPEGNAEQVCNARKLKEAAESKVKGQIFTHLLYRHWNAYKEGKRTHIFIAGPCGVSGTSNGAARTECPAEYPLDLTPGNYDAPVFSLGGQDDYAFSPDGQEICYASNHDKNPAASTNNDLWIVPVNVGADASSAQVLAKTKNITADNPASDTSPLYSPDGRYIAYRAQQRPGYESDRFRLMLYDRKTGEKKNLTEKLDSWVGTFVWSPDSKRIYFAHQWQDEAPVISFAIDRPFDQTITVDSGPEANRSNADVVVRDGYNDDIALTPDGKTIVFTRMSLSFPNEIYKAGSDKTVAEQLAHPPNRLTHLNDTLLSDVAMSPLESFWFKGAKADKVQGFVVKPPNFDASKKYPVQFLIHGGPQGAWGDDWSYRWNPELFASPTSSTPTGYVVLMINFHGSTGYGQKFIDAINGDWGGAPYEDLMKGLDYAEEHYGFIDKTRECALGASYGGYMSNWILGHTDRFKCIVTHDGMFNAESAWGTTEELWFNNWEFK